MYMFACTYIYVRKYAYPLPFLPCTPTNTDTLIPLDMCSNNHHQVKEALLSGALNVNEQDDKGYILCCVMRCNIYLSQPNL